MTKPTDMTEIPVMELEELKRGYQRGKAWDITVDVMLGDWIGRDALEEFFNDTLEDIEEDYDGEFGQQTNTIE